MNLTLKTVMRTYIEVVCMWMIIFTTLHLFVTWVG